MFTHLDENNRGQMVDISEKKVTRRKAIARGKIRLKEETIDAIKKYKIKKGDVLAISQVAAVQGAKSASQIIPLAHPILINHVGVDFSFEDDGIICQVEVVCDGKTGVEMEALSGCSAGLLTIYDMCKSMDRGMVIESIYLLEKSGGRSGDYRREEK